MEISIFVFLSSGLFLGWSLGANDAANVFGTAVGSRMLRFTTAAVICSIFLTLGAVFGGAGAAHGLGKLGSVNALPGAFMVALSAAITVYAMTKAGLPVSTTQAIVGAIIGWNLFSGMITDTRSVSRIVATWIGCPILGAIFAAILYTLITWIIRGIKPHMLRLDFATRAGLLLAGAFGAYSLGANNIGNVMGVFVESSPFTPIRIGTLYVISSTQQLFLLGAVSISVGVVTYSKRVMMTVGKSLMPLNPVAAWVVVVSHSLVLFLFSSSELEHFLAVRGLPTLPLIPVSSSQAVIGAVVGLALLKGPRGMRQVKWTVLCRIGSGWVTTPVIAALACFTMLFFLQNVFNQQVYHEAHYVVSKPVIARADKEGLPAMNLEPLQGQDFVGGIHFVQVLREAAPFTRRQSEKILTIAEIVPSAITEEKLAVVDHNYLSEEQVTALTTLQGSKYRHRWELQEALAKQSPAWKPLKETPENRRYNARLSEQLDYAARLFSAEDHLAFRPVE